MFIFQGVRSQIRLNFLQPETCCSEGEIRRPPEKEQPSPEPRKLTLVG